MAKIIAPFKIVGTLDDLTFYLDQENNNLVKTKGNPGITKKQFAENPIFHTIKKHGLEFGRCAKKSQSFRNTALQFFNRAKDGSFAGRANKLMLEITNEDHSNPKGERTVENGMESEESPSYFVGFEGNKTRKLAKVVKAKWRYDASVNQFTIKGLLPEKHLDWPAEAETVHIAIARSNWNYCDNTFTTEYSNEITIDKNDKASNISLTAATPAGNHIELVYLFIGFSYKDRRKTVELKRINNTVTILQARRTTATSN